MKTTILYFLVFLNLLLLLGLGLLTRESNLIFSENLRVLEKKVHAWSPLKYEGSELLEMEISDLNNLDEIRKEKGKKHE
ncbi:hypothetical protein [Sulfurimonas sp.]|uniref:hypothetical protein n=1 Tax=Sulfurimonas sp. TaxID=2022749 RepID=UPI002603E69E|nr:hypothetical protein [Sulfurimonas sp.]MDD3452459.1 hypothetical protein [Sulfurimonas sp.]